MDSYWNYIESILSQPISFQASIPRTPLKLILSKITKNLHVAKSSEFFFILTLLDLLTTFTRTLSFLTNLCSSLRKHYTVLIFFINHWTSLRFYSWLFLLSLKSESWTITGPSFQFPLLNFLLVLKLKCYYVLMSPRYITDLNFRLMCLVANWHFQLNPK